MSVNVKMFSCSSAVWTLSLFVLLSPESFIIIPLHSLMPTVNQTQVTLLLSDSSTSVTPFWHLIMLFSTDVVRNPVCSCVWLRCLKSLLQEFGRLSLPPTSLRPGECCQNQIKSVSPQTRDKTRCVEVQSSTLEFNGVQWSTVNSVECSSVKYSDILCSTVERWLWPWLFVLFRQHHHWWCGVCDRWRKD